MVSVRKATPADSPAIAALHREQIPWGLLSSMGPRFVDAFYATLLASNVGFAFLAEDDAGAVGFTAGIVRWRTFYRVFLLRNWTLAFAIVARRLFDLKRWRRLFETSRYAATATLPEAEFLSMAVLPRARGSGMSDALVRHLLDEFAGRGVTQVRVTTAFSNQASARVFERTGFRWLEDVEIHPGEVARIYVITLGEAGRTA